MNTHLHLILYLKIFIYFLNLLENYNFTCEIFGGCEDGFDR